MGARRRSNPAPALAIVATLLVAVAAADPARAQMTAPAPLTPTASMAPTPHLRETALWGGVSTGMTSAEVRSLYPDAVLVTGPTADTGYLRTLKSPAPPVDGHAATALFRFHNDRLFGVRLDVGGLPSAADRENRTLVARLVKDYSARDAAYDCADNSRADTNLIDCKWLAAGASIRLEYMDVAGQAPYLKIIYSSIADVGSDL